MIVRATLAGMSFLAFLACASLRAETAGRVQLEIVGGGQGAALTFQQWSEALGKAGIRDFRLSSGAGSEKVGIETRGTERSPLYVVTATINAQNELVVPGKRFRKTETASLAEWLKDLAANGPPEKRPAKGAFGLTADQFAALHGDLARVVSFSTKGTTRAEAVEKIRAKLKTPVRIERAAAAALKDDKIDDELSGLASGTALAYVLRPAGYCLVPRVAGGKVELAVVASRPKLDIWPIGFPPKDGARAVLPAINEFHNVNVQNAAVGDLIATIGERLKTPVLIDHNAVARYGLDLAKPVSVPGGKTTYSLALKRALFKAGLEFEVRVDEADKPFLWVSSVKPM